MVRRIYSSLTKDSGSEYQTQTHRAVARIGQTRHRDHYHQGAYKVRQNPGTPHYINCHGLSAFIYRG